LQINCIRRLIYKIVFNLKIAEDAAGYQKTLSLFDLNENCNGKIGTY
jgi:hypothetical protein